ncbi:hypothetical protein GWI33_004186 [Rhynchophorus ferrugineus]|uniref:Uncharacterized protein n=1 Tax=Rhynchophorus ferrugineus TaxID=354439 RepID=A0A834IQI3_RHYFE|nr:hypothetical protein GWI33_004186 [Rhynchophorus ferrugineus]
MARHLPDFRDLSHRAGGDTVEIGRREKVTESSPIIKHDEISIFESRGDWSDTRQSDTSPSIPCRYTFKIQFKIYWICLRSVTSNNKTSDPFTSTEGSASAPSPFLFLP